MSDLYTTNIIKAQLQNLVVSHRYKVFYTLHYTNQSLSAYLDKPTLEFTSNSNIQNIFVVLTKDSDIKTVLLEIKVFDLDNDSALAHSSFINCDDFDPCEPLVTPTNTPTPSITPTNTVTPSVTPTNTITPSITPSITPTHSITPTTTPTISVTPSITPTNISANFLASYAPDYGDFNGVSIKFGSSSAGIVLFGDGDGRVFNNNSIITKNPNNNFWNIYPGVSASWTDVASSSIGDKLVAVSNMGGKIYTSNDYGSSWFLTSASSSNWKSVASSADGNKLVAVIQNGGISISSDSGVSWSLSSAPFANWWKVVSSTDGTVLIATSANNGVYISSDSGSTWTKTSLPDGDWRGLAANNNCTKLVASIYGGGIYISTDSGLTWNQTSAPNANWTSIASSSDGAKLFATNNNGSIYVSYNSGSLWTQSSVPVLNWQSITSSADGIKLMTIGSNTINDNLRRLYVSYNSGKTWHARGSDSKWISVAMNSDGDKIIAADNLYLYAKDIEQQLNVSPSYNNITFYNNTGNNKNLALLSIDSWGLLTSIDNICSNTYNNIHYGTDNLNHIPSSWNNITTAKEAFAGCRSLGNIVINSNSLINMSGTFISAGIDNITINSSSIIDTTNCFKNSTLSSFSISDSSSITAMSGMFDGCLLLDSDFTGFSLSGLDDPTSLTTFMRGVTLSAANYNKTLAYWDANKNSYLSNISINMGNSKADSFSGGVNGIQAKLNLILHGWTIVDGQ